jgi:Tol biopolymer transport system component
MRAKSGKGAVGVCALLTALAVVVAGASGASSAPPGAGGQIVFVRGNNLWLVQPDGAAPRRFTHPVSGVSDDDPAWSPDGQKVVFLRDSDTDLYVIRADGRDLKKLPLQAQSLGSLQYLGHPRWSPDGRRLAFDALVASDGCQIYVGSLNERYARPLGRDHSASDSPCDYFPDWSPDGHWIAFSRRSGSGPTRLYLIDPSGKRLHRLTAHKGNGPRWSPDGKRIAFFDGNSVFVINADGTGLKKVSAGFSPAWSPNGSELVFVREEPGKRNALSDLWVTDVSGSQPRRIVKGGWSADW